MRDQWRVLLVALRAVVWKRTPAAIGELRLFTFVLWCLALLACWLALEYLRIRGSGSTFNVYGINSSVAWLALYMTVTGLFVRSDRRLVFLAALAAMTVLLDAGLEAVGALTDQARYRFVGDSWWRAMGVWLGVMALWAVWWTGGVTRLLHSLQPEVSRPLRRASAMCAAVLAVFTLVPHYPTFVSRNFERQTANAWEYVRTAMQEPEGDRGPPPEIAEAELAQPAMLDAMTARLAPQRPGVSDIYAIGVAGWSQQDVFQREVDGALGAIDRFLPIANRVMHLVNHPSTMHSLPFANRQNFAAAVRAIGRVMNKDEDVLLVFLTSHGSRDGVALVMPGVVNAALKPEDLASVLDREGIKNRILIVSACYSGVFVKPLANENTIVLTAADENSLSFGCSNEREWTYFGDALFNQSLKPGKDLKRAFYDAKSLIGVWETTEGISPSNPQGHFGEALLARLAPAYIAVEPALPDDDDGPAHRLRRAEAQQ
jgi:hypothetical protein